MVMSSSESSEPGIDIETRSTKIQAIVFGVGQLQSRNPALIITHQQLGLTRVIRL
jgi:hypothetical protein